MRFFWKVIAVVSLPLLIVSQVAIIHRACAPKNKTKEITGLKVLDFLNRQFDLDAGCLTVSSEPFAIKFDGKKQEVHSDRWKIDFTDPHLSKFFDVEISFDPQDHGIIVVRIKDITLIKKNAYDMSFKIQYTDGDDTYLYLTKNYNFSIQRKRHYKSKKNYKKTKTEIDNEQEEDQEIENEDHLYLEETINDKIENIEEESRSEITESSEEWEYFWTKEIVRAEQEDENTEEIIFFHNKDLEGEERSNEEELEEILFFKEMEYKEQEHEIDINTRSAGEENIYKNQENTQEINDEKELFSEESEIQENSWSEERISKEQENAEEIENEKELSSEKLESERSVYEEELWFEEHEGESESIEEIINNELEEFNGINKEESKIQDLRFKWLTIEELECEEWRFVEEHEDENVKESGNDGSERSESIGEEIENLEESEDEDVKEMRFTDREKSEQEDIDDEESWSEIKKSSDFNELFDKQFISKETNNKDLQQQQINNLSDKTTFKQIISKVSKDVCLIVGTGIGGIIWTFIGSSIGGTIGWYVGPLIFRYWLNYEEESVRSVYIENIQNSSQNIGGLLGLVAGGIFVTISSMINSARAIGN